MTGGGGIPAAPRGWDPVWHLADHPVGWSGDCSLVPEWRALGREPFFSRPQEAQDGRHRRR
eukprot:7971784-Alexandrium_andersonii.AAC.1